MDDEGAPVVPVEHLEDQFKTMTRAFFGNLYDFREDNRKKNQALLGLIVVLILVLVMFGRYVATHTDVELRVIDTSQAGQVPFRVLAFDEKVEGKEGLYYYFFSFITTHLFGYNKNTIIGNRKAVAQFLDGNRIKGLERDTDRLLEAFNRLERFPEGNPACQVKNVVFLEDQGANKVIQVYADITLMGEDGEVQKPRETYLITYKVQNRKVRTKDEIRLNPLGIQIVEWQYQKVMDP